MKYCNRCLQPDTRPNIVFSAEGVCPACLYLAELQRVDWTERFEILRDVIGHYRRPSPDGFDCIIGVSGGKDSTRQALFVRDRLGLNPLLVCLTYPPEQVTERGVDNISNLIELGFDVVISALAPQVWRTLVREAFLRFANWARATEMALFSAVPQLAIRYRIPLILWGENPALQIGDMNTLGRTGYDGNNARYGNTLSGGDANWMHTAAVNEGQLIGYRYPEISGFERAGLQIVYLGWFLGDWSLVNNGAYSAAHGLHLRTEDVRNTGDLRGVSALDEDWVSLNQMIKYYKFGFGKVTEYVNEEIRLGRMTRERGIDLVESLDSACSPEYIASFADYVEMTVDEFWVHVRKYVNRRLFDVAPDGVITPRFRVGVGL